MRMLEEIVQACETVEDIEDLWYKVASKAKSYLHEDIAGLQIFVEDLNPESIDDINAIAETRAEVDEETGELLVTIYFDEAFYALTTLYQVAVVCHEMGHAERIYNLYDNLLIGEIEDWNKEARSGGHGAEWKKITRNIAVANAIKSELALIERIDYTDDKYFQSKLADIENGRTFE